MGCAAISKFFAKYMVFAQMIIMGCASSLYDFGEMLLPKNLFIITMVKMCIRDRWWEARNFCC